MDSDGVRAAAWIGVVGTVTAAVIAGIFALVLNHESSGAAPIPNTSVPSTTLAPVETTITPDHITEAPTPVVTAAPVETQPIYHEGDVNLVSGGRPIGLDSTPDNPRWDDSEDDITYDARGKRIYTQFC